MLGGNRESGLGLVGLFLGSTALAVAVLGTVGGLMTSLKVAIDSKDHALAADEARDVAKQVRAEAGKDFEAALATYETKQMVREGNRNVRTRIILDETRFAPPIDLNGDGDFDDAKLSPRQVHAAFLETRVSWGRNRTLTSIAIVRRKSANAAPAR